MPTPPSPHASPAPHAPARRDCVLDELVQYQCQLRGGQVVCEPLVRIFERCAGQPAIEVTPVYDAHGRAIAPAPAGLHTAQSDLFVRRLRRPH
ncbi:hypothetical protein GGF31_002697 [Allomyces arbusculus]|nr:hypothetical protein GGF31_002697 [Allomyces arbusculus]